MDPACFQSRAHRSRGLDVLRTLADAMPGCPTARPQSVADHAQAGLRAAQEIGSTASVLAGDVLAAVAMVIRDLN